MKTTLRHLCLIASLGAVPASHAAMDAKAAAEMMTKAGCIACHQIDKKLVGPSYKDVSAKNKSNAKAADLLFQKVRAGGANVYGPIPMPPNPKEKIGDDDLHTLIGWILTL